MGQRTVFTPRHGPWPAQTETICWEDGTTKRPAADQGRRVIVTTPRQGPFPAERECIRFDREGNAQTEWRKRYQGR